MKDGTENQAGPEARLRALPPVNGILEELDRRHPDLPLGRTFLRDLVRETLEKHRRRLTSGAAPETAPDAAALAAEVARTALCGGGLRMRRVINATGIILHSGIGRAVLAREALEAVAAQSGYCLLAVRDEDGEREERDVFIVDILRRLTGAEDGHVVNNNAAATMIILNTLAAGREVICPHGQLVEIGGQFRIPEVMEMSGCRLRAVGTTNKTYVADYEKAIGPSTGALLVVHPSNYRIQGFHEEPSIAELVALGRRTGLPVIHDLGSGNLLEKGLPAGCDEPAVAGSLRAGADLVCMSGDKLIGGPQAGIILGRRDIVERIRRNPLARALRIDKLTCVALEATLRVYLDPATLAARIPTLRMLLMPPAAIERAAARLAEAIRRTLPGLPVELEASTSFLGSGALPAVGLPTTCVVLPKLPGPAGDVARRLRLRPVSVFTRVHAGAVRIDPRTLQEGEDTELVEALADVLGSPPESP